MKKLLEGRVCVLSGCGPGTGAAIARAFADEGASVVLTSQIRIWGQLKHRSSINYCYVTCDRSRE